MVHTDLWPLAREALQALTAHYGPAIDHAAEGVGIPFGEWYGWLMAARIFEPDPVSAARLQRRSAYTSPAKLEEQLAKGRRLGLLEPVGAGEYRLNKAGGAAVQRLIETAYAAMAPLRPLPEGDLARLAGLLQRLVEASLAAPEPPGKWCLRTARHYDPGAGAPVMVRLDQYLSDLNAYRDDAHLAAWQPYGVSGQAWEAFTCLWRGAATTLDALHTRLLHRGYPWEAYSAALDELVRRAWVTRDAETCRLTDDGRVLREQAEANTDRYFYAAWAGLSETELAELRDLLTRFREGLDQLRT
ncbi:MAG: hypothetical protein CVU38_10765 [Chloroflexi bacterium HGW-Chloroflexi-1]|nr:MAG: hypothetical protein CVU38_10765 [Chloroflexi bacterium HGW-Chloroflexi-1]